MREAIVVAVVLSVLFFIIYIGRTGQAQLPAPEIQAAESLTAVETISAQELEEQHGLRVRLIAVTAGGGMIDFRLKILDAEKAQHFLQDPANLPRLIAAETGTALMAPQGIGDDIQWEKDGILFFLVPNSGGAIKPGAPVAVEFGNVRLEPVLAK